MGNMEPEKNTPNTSAATSPTGGGLLLQHTPDRQCIGIVAGRGQFPALVAGMAAKHGSKVVICGFYDHTDQSLASLSSAFCLLHLGQLGKLIKFFKKQKVTHICFAGAISKPKALNIRPDWRALSLLLNLRAFGDDALLRAVACELEKEGFNVVQAASLLPGLAAPLGVLGSRNPSLEEWEDIVYGWPMAQNIGRLDIGQCIVVRRKMVMAVECLEGTDATLARGGELGGEGCSAIKIVKPGQDERLDLPAIGLDTINMLLKHNYACLAYQAGKTLFFDRDQSLQEANRGGLCLIGLPDNALWESIWQEVKKELAANPDLKTTSAEDARRKLFLEKLQMLALQEQTEINTI